MREHKTAGQLESEMIEKAAAIEDMQTHPGWKYLAELVGQLIERETANLTGQPLDNSYYKRIGFLQMYRYCKELPNIIKDKQVRNYLLSQGRSLGARTFLNAPKLFLEGMMKGNEKLRQWFEDSNLQLVEKKKKEFNESNLK